MARKTREAREWSARRKGGGKGPVKTQPKHGKVNRRPYGQSRNSPTKKEESMIMANWHPLAILVALRSDDTIVLKGY